MASDPFESLTRSAMLLSVWICPLHGSSWPSPLVMRVAQTTKPFKAAASTPVRIPAPVNRATTTRPRGKTGLPNV